MSDDIGDIDDPDTEDIDDATDGSGGSGGGGGSRVGAAIRAARAGAETANERFRRDLDVETKSGKTDLVTEADRESQRRVIRTLREGYPNDAVVGEEEDDLKTVPDDGPAWVVDPIDGTNNFVRGLRTFATAVAATADGEPIASAVVAPALDDAYVCDGEATERNGEPVSVSGRGDPEAATVAPTMYWGYDRRAEYAAACRETVERFGDLRRFGCAQLTLAAVADGGLEGTFTNVDSHPWDTVAGVHMVRAAGGRVTDLDGDRWRHDSSGLVASNGAVHGEVLAAAGATEAARE